MGRGSRDLHKKGPKGLNGRNLRGDDVFVLPRPKAAKLMTEAEEKSRTLRPARSTTEVAISVAPTCTPPTIIFSTKELRVVPAASKMETLCDNEKRLKDID